MRSQADRDDVGGKPTDFRRSDSADLYNPLMFVRGSLHCGNGVSAILADQMQHLDVVQLSTFAIQVTVRAPTETEMENTE